MYSTVQTFAFPIFSIAVERKCIHNWQFIKKQQQQKNNYKWKVDAFCSRTTIHKQTQQKNKTKVKKSYKFGRIKIVLTIYLNTVFTE